MASTIIGLLILNGFSQIAFSMVSGVGYLLGKLPEYQYQRFVLGVLSLGLALALHWLREIHERYSS